MQVLEKCGHCGGTLGPFREIIDGAPWHPRCALSVFKKVAAATNTELWAANRLSQIISEPGYGGGSSGSARISRSGDDVVISRDFARLLVSLIGKLN